MLVLNRGANADESKHPLGRAATHDDDAVDVRTGKRRANQAPSTLLEAIQLQHNHSQGALALMIQNQVGFGYAMLCYAITGYVGDRTATSTTTHHTHRVSVCVCARGRPGRCMAARKEQATPRHRTKRCAMATTRWVLVMPESSPATDPRQPACMTGLSHTAMRQEEPHQQPQRQGQQASDGSKHRSLWHKVLRGASGLVTPAGRLLVVHDTLLPTAYACAGV